MTKHIQLYLHYPSLDNTIIEYDKLQYTEESLYSITAHYYNSIICKQIKLMLKQQYQQRNQFNDNQFNENYKMVDFNDSYFNQITILDATGNVGSDTIGFARNFGQVISIEINQENFQALQHNVQNVYKLKNVQLHLGDSNQLASNILKSVKPNVLYIDPPWGTNYQYEKQLTLKLGTKSLYDWIILAQKLVPGILIVLKLPNNYYFPEFQQFESQTTSLFFQSYTIVFIQTCADLPSYNLSYTPAKRWINYNNNNRNNNNNRYCSIQSNNQIEAFMKSSQAYLPRKLTSLFIKMLKFNTNLTSHDVDTFMWSIYLDSKMKNTKLYDSDVYSHFHNILLNSRNNKNENKENNSQENGIENISSQKDSIENISSQEDSIENVDNQESINLYNREQKKAQDIYSLLNSINISNCKTLLDFGGLKGYFCEYLGKQLNFLPENCHSADIQDSLFDIQNGEKSKQVVHITLNENKTSIPLQDGSVDIITCLQTLHHVKNVDSALQELSRICNTKNGILVLREHDCTDMETSMLIDIEHSIWDIVLNPKLSDSERKAFPSKYYGQYRSKFEWTNLLKKCGFHYYKHIQYPYLPPHKNVTKYYYAIYTKNNNTSEFSFLFNRPPTMLKGIQ